MENIKKDHSVSEKGIFILDCETDGLYGSFLTAAVVATDPELNIVKEYYFGVPAEIEKARDPWVLQHVLPILGNYQRCTDEQELLEKVWSLWMQYREDHYAMADVNFPVENRFFARCVEIDPEHRKFLAPFPLLDLSSILYSQGIDPLTPRPSIADVDEAGQHNALFDVEMSVSILKKLRGNML